VRLKSVAESACESNKILPFFGLSNVAKMSETSVICKMQKR